MSDLLTCYVERANPVALVRLTGTLDLDTAGTARSALLACLEQEPSALVLDVASQPLAPRVTEALDPDRRAPARAREPVAAACDRWRVAALAPVAQLIATELVSNGVMHARTPLVFTVLLSNDRLYVAVHDRDPHPARMIGPRTEFDEHGRGLLVVDSLASSWGSLPTPVGKVVWAAVGPP